MKKLVSLLLSLLMIVLAVPAVSASQTITDSDMTVNPGDIVHYEYYLDLTGIGGISGKADVLQGTIEFDNIVLRVKPTWITQSSQTDHKLVMPQLRGGDVVFNFKNDNRILYNAYKQTGYSFSPKALLIKLDFEAVATGTIQIDHSIASLGSGKQKLIKGGVELTAVSKEEIITVERISSSEYTTTDPETGIRVITADPVELSVSRVSMPHFGYILSDIPANDNVFKLTLTSNGEVYQSESPVKVIFPRTSEQIAVCTVTDSGEVKSVDSTAAETGLDISVLDFSGVFALLTTTDPVRTHMLGDVDFDEEISILDATHIQRHLARIKIFDDLQMLLADTDRDDEVSILDATAIQRYLAQLINDYKNP